MANKPPQTFYPKVSDDIPWESRKHFQLIYQKLNNHALAFANITSAAKGVTNTTIENFGGGGSGGVTPIMGLGGVNDQSGVTAYTTTVADNGVILILDDASPVAVTLSTGVTSPWLIFINNLGVGLVTLTPSSGTINGGATFTIPFDYSSIVAFDGTNFWATVLPVVPVNTPAVAHEFFTAYNAVTGAFTQAQPAFTDVSGQITTAQLPASGLTTTITTAKLTVGGSNGSMVFTNGSLTASTPAT